MRTKVVIERVVLRGVPVRAQRRLSDSLKGELGALLTRHGLPPAAAQGGHTPRVQAGPVPVDRAAGDDAALGRGIARRVFGALSGGPAGTKGD